MPLQTVRPGDAIKADSWNQVVGAIGQVRDAVLPGNDIANQLPWIKSLSDIDLEPFQVLQLNAPMFIDDDQKLGDFRALGSWSGVKPDGNGLGRIAVMATECKASHMGRMYRGGLVPVRVNITKDWLYTCDLELNSHILKTKLEGAAKIVWKAAATGADVRCVVQIGPVIDRFYWGVSQGNIPAWGWGTVRVFEPDGGPDYVDVTNVKLEHCNDDTDIANNTDVRIWFSQLDNSWHVDGAACEPN